MKGRLKEEKGGKKVTFPFIQDKTEGGPGQGSGARAPAHPHTYVFPRLCTFRHLDPEQIRNRVRFVFVSIKIRPMELN